MSRRNKHSAIERLGAYSEKDEGFALIIVVKAVAGLYVHTEGIGNVAVLFGKAYRIDSELALGLCRVKIINISAAVFFCLLFL